MRQTVSRDTSLGDRANAPARGRLCSGRRVRRCVTALIVLALASVPPALAQSNAAPPRVTIPMPESVRRAIAAGTRDSSGVPGPRYWQLYVHYDLEAELHPASAEVVGAGRIRFRNPSPQALTSIQLRLDQNRFRFGNVSSPAPSHHTDGVTITKLVVNGTPAQITGEHSSVRPALTDPRVTSVTLLLDRAIGVGESVVIDVNWRFAVPLDETGQSLRLGREGTDLFQVAQWYPRVAMLDDLNGWDMSSYLGDVEFYNPFADFNVRVRVPSGWLVGATGVLQNPDEVLPAPMRERLATALRSDSIVEVATPAETRSRSETLAGGMSTWHFRADSVSDFAWGTSSRYGWTSGRALIDGREPVALHRLYASSRGVPAGSLVHRLRDRLVYSSRLMTPYRFPQHTLLDGPESGMEYPMLTMFGVHAPLGHEVWHQWFPMTVGTDESRYAFLDEGLASFLPDSTPSRARTPVSGSPQAARRYMLAPLISEDQPEASGAFAALYAYGRVSPMLHALSDSVGQDRVMEALAAYTRTWSLKHPTPWDFMHFMNRSLDRDLSAFWYKWIFTTEP